MSFDRVLNAETLVKIAVRQHNRVARPFPKFFNLDEAIANGEQLPAEAFEVTEKLDGSLGILYWLDGEPRLATRGTSMVEAKPALALPDGQIP